MSQPVRYDKATNFTEYATAHPSAPFPPASLDTELTNAQTTLDGLCDNIALIQRDDGKLANQSIHADALTPAVYAMIGDWLPRGLWVTATAYAVKDIVDRNGAAYVCAVAHTSGTFTTDYSAGKWVSVTAPPATFSGTASDVPSTPAGGLSATNVQAALNELDTEKAPLASPTFTGNPTAPTPSPLDSDTSIATTAFVMLAISALAPLANPTFTGTVVLPTTTLGGNLTGFSGALTITANGISEYSTTAGKPAIELENRTADATSPGLYFYKQRAGANTQSGDAQINVQGYGYANSALRQAALIQSVQDAAVSGNTVPTAIVFSTQLSGGSIQENLRIDSTGRLLAAGSSAAAGYTSRGDITLPSTGLLRAKNSAKVLAYITISGGTPSVNASSFNVTSVTDNGQGDFTVNFTNALANTNYVLGGACKGNGGHANLEEHQSGTRSTSAVRVRILDYSPNDVDPSFFSLIVFGD